MKAYLVIPTLLLAWGCEESADTSHLILDATPRQEADVEVVEKDAEVIPVLDCETGFEQGRNDADAWDCLDVDECKQGVDCGPGGVCENNPGGYSCKCNDGYELVEGLCADIDECKLPITPCGKGGDCENTEGSHRCTCHNGYELSKDKLHCYDFNECGAQENPCGPGTCENNDGSYDCLCNPGARSCVPPECDHITCVPE